MTKAQLREELLKLPFDERIEIAEMLVASDGSLPLRDWQMRAIDTALEEYRERPGGEQTWNEVEAELWPDG